jgi:hydrogenase maturation factor
MLGEVPVDSLITTSGAQPDDSLIMTKGIAVEGTSIIARENAHDLLAVLGHDLLTRAAAFLTEPGISVVEDARVATSAVPGKIHAMHDPTEGGLVTGLHELALASGLGLEVYQDLIPVFPETRALCDHYRLDPLGLIASGSLLMAVEAGYSLPVIRALSAEGIAAYEIGRMLAPGAESGIIVDGRREPLPVFARDELARLYEL